MQRAYNPRNVTLSIWGEKITEFGSSMVTITPNSPLLTHTAGAQGDQGTTVVADRSGTLEFSVQQNARVNATLIAWINAATRTGQWPSGACTLTDTSSPIIPIMRDCQLSTRPDFSRGAEQQDVVYQLFISELEYVPQENIGSDIVNTVVNANVILDAVNKLKDIFN